MRAVVVYESMYGNTHLIADSIAMGLAAAGGVDVVPVGKATQEVVRDADLLVIGAPTHAHGMPRPKTREMARQIAAKRAGELTLDRAAETPGVREWIAAGGNWDRRAVAFDTRAHGPGIFTGRASKGIERSLRRHGYHLVLPAESFFVKGDRLAPGELDRARAWGMRLAAQMLNAQRAAA